jgi:hypothetical protein
VSLTVAITATHTVVARNALQLTEELKITKYPRFIIPVKIIQWTLVSLKFRGVLCLDNSDSEHRNATPYPSRRETSV